MGSECLEGAMQENPRRHSQFIFLLSFPINSLLQGSLFVNCQMSLAVQCFSHILLTIWSSLPFLSLLNSIIFFYKANSDPFSSIMPFWPTGINRVYSLLILNRIYYSYLCVDNYINFQSFPSFAGIKISFHIDFPYLIFSYD